MGYTLGSSIAHRRLADTHMATVTQHQTLEVRLNISAREYLLLYKGVARNVSALATDGRRVRFPAAILQRFVTHDGIFGLFAITFDAQGRFKAIEKRA